MKKPLRLGFTSFITSMEDFFVDTLSEKYDITIDNENPEVLFFAGLDDTSPPSHHKYDKAKRKTKNG